jgi:ATP-dependent helicase/nuclease subunit B
MTLKRLSDDDWRLAHDYARRMDEVLADLSGDQAARQSLDRHIGLLMQVLAATVDEAADPDSAEALDQLVQSMDAAERFMPACDQQRAWMFLTAWLRRLPVRRSLNHPRLTILGLLEARLIHPDLVIMGGLTEGSWPAQPDPGPWINRPMRAMLELAQPERSIGLTAHDFAQTFGAREVVLTWSKRVNDQPAVASRWVLRLQMILAATGVSHDTGTHWLAWARSFDDARGDRRVVMPRPKPPVDARPRSLSITQVEKLMRDPYRIYSEKVLKVQPLSPIGAVADPGLKGNLIHSAFSLFATAYPTVLPHDAEAQLLRIGREVFAPHFADADVSGFWWPRFERIVPWFIAEERQMRKGVAQTYAEVTAAYRFGDFTLTGRADRIDVLNSGKARLIDYKTGRIPTSNQVKSGLAPQLTLEAALLSEGCFKGISPLESAELLYVKLSGGEPPGLLIPIADIEVMPTAHEHIEMFKSLMHAYDDDSCAYIPRAAMEKEQDTSPFDHLSRWREWSLAEEES